MKMKRIVIRTVMAIMVLTVVVPFMSGIAFAATNVTISGDDEVSVNSEFTVQIEFSGDETAKVDGQIGFDSSKLEYVSGGADGGEGYVILNKDGGEGSVVFNITFRAIKGGNTGIDVSSSEITDINKNPLENCAATKVIHISGDKNSDADDENVVQEEKVPEPTAEDMKPVGISPIMIAGGLALIAAVIAVIVIVRRKGKGKSKSR